MRWIRPGFTETLARVLSPTPISQPDTLYVHDCEISRPPSLSSQPCTRLFSMANPPWVTIGRTFSCALSALLVLTSCSSGSDSASPETPETPSSSRPAPGASDDTRAFFDEANKICRTESRLEKAPLSIKYPEAYLAEMSGILDEGMDALGQLDAPPSVAADFENLIVLMARESQELRDFLIAIAAGAKEYGSKSHEAVVSYIQQGPLDKLFECDDLGLVGLTDFKLRSIERTLDEQYYEEHYDEGTGTS